MKNLTKKFLILWCLCFTFSCGEDSLPEVEAAFSADKEILLEGESVTFTDTSIGNPDSWSWVFEGGNPSVSDLQNPTVVYSNSGTYSVSLTVSNEQNTDEITNNDMIVVVQEVATAFTALDSTIDQGGQVSFQDLSMGANRWEWQFEGGTPESSQEQNPVITYDQAGIYEVTLRAGNEIDSMTVDKSEFIFVRPTENLVAYYPLDGNALDNSGNQLNGNVVDGAPSQNRHGIENEALAFDGVDDYISVANDQLFENQNYSISAWFLAEQDTGTVASFSVPPSGKNNSGYNLSIIDGFLRGTSNINSGVWAVVIAESELSLNEWHHAVFTYDGASMKLYLNNELIAINSEAHNVNFNEHNPFIIGTYASSSGGTWFTGKLDDIRVYSAELDETAIRTLFVE